MKRRSKPGSALLLVIMITLGLSLLSFSCWYKSSLLLDLVLQRERFYKNFYLTESFLKYGCFLTKNNFEYYFKTTDSKHPKVINLDFLIKRLGIDKVNKSFNAELILKKIIDDQLVVCSVLRQVQTAFCKVSCKILKLDDIESFTVKNFSIGNFI